MKLSDFPKYIIFFILSIYFSTFFLHKQSYTNLDQGKLVKYGEVIWQDKTIFTKNLFSYTFPEYQFTNHHWGTGLLFYGIDQLGGLGALTILGLILNILGYWLFFYLAARDGNFWATIFVVLLTIPLLTSRDQPRPEAISILFFCITLFLVYQHQTKKINIRYLWFLPFLQLIWINFHILFFLGLFIQSLYFLHLLINFKFSKDTRYFLYIILSSGLLSLINPSGIYGLLYPLRIMGDIQYAVTENISLISAISFNGNYSFLIYHQIIFLCLGILIYFFVRNKQLFIPNLFYILVAVSFTILALYRVRAGVFLGYIVLLLTPIVISKLKTKETIKNIVSISFILILFFMINLLDFNFYKPYRNDKPGIGIEKDLDNGARFLINNRIKGPIFNNFDIGDYLIYYLYPNEKVFVDSRPEAYPPGFMNDKLIAAINDQKAWLDLDREYNFNAIVLGYHPQVKEFTERLFYDSRWFLAYSDNYTAVYLKMNDENKALIRKELLTRKSLDFMIQRFDYYSKTQSIW